MAGSGRGTERETLESVDLHAALGSDALIDEEGGNLLPLISLQLDHLAQLGIFHECSIAAKFLFECADDALEIKLSREPLHGGQGLASISLLNSYMDVAAGLAAKVITLIFREGVCKHLVSNQKKHEPLCFAPTTDVRSRNNE
eukprot:TRINITY_DN384_c0_g1_i2.p1 TRINITY_DN384_c0_g1~~TRINITY_DN384_c0_g1_i2.p1  ORF type:complete len:143 (+),score=22.23 TRINITY_DN384_c0_g1_i2:596-1024(+)